MLLIYSPRAGIFLVSESLEKLSSMSSLVSSTFLLDFLSLVAPALVEFALVELALVTPVFLLLVMFVHPEGTLGNITLRRRTFTTP